MLWYLPALGLFAYWILVIYSGINLRSSVKSLKRLPLNENEVPIPQLSVVVAARNEEAAIRRCITGLLQQTHPNLQIIIVDDRSTDSTGAIADELAGENPGRLQVEHLTECPNGWLGKCNALHQGGLKATGQYTLFLDGDVILESTALERATVYAQQQNADMVVALPDVVAETAGEKCMMITFAQCFSIAFSPARAQDKHSRDFIGVGAFNLVRTSLYRKVQGHRFLRLQIVDDVALGKVIKHAGGVVRVLSGREMVRVRWQPSLWETIRGLEKNGFASMGYSVIKTLIATGGLLSVYWWPFVGMFVGPPLPRLLCASVALLIQPLYGIGTSFYSGFSRWYGLLSPIGAVFMATAILRSMYVTLRQGGVRWRDSFYPLRELRQHRL